jgi:hypothetical protein
VGAEERKKGVKMEGGYNGKPNKRWRVFQLIVFGNTNLHKTEPFIGDKLRNRSYLPKTCCMIGHSLALARMLWMDNGSIALRTNTVAPTIVTHQGVADTSWIVTIPCQNTSTGVNQAPLATTGMVAANGVVHRVSCLGFISPAPVFSVE